ncbi:MAG: hypothetical protein ACR652_02785 [Methylocystis sp.]|uniref:hypothetical protein n=1 Tax=Methylocystis sp. TaxID=1911079 RepID=UPI003DA4D679
MMTPPKDRVEIVLMSDQPHPLHLWIQTTAELARRLDYNKEKSVRILGGAVILLLAAFFLSPGSTIILLLLGLIVIFPLTLVGMVGFFKES